MDPQETKVYMNEGFQIFWNADDLVSVFAGTTQNRQYCFSGSNGSTSGDLVPVDNAAGGTSLAKNYAAFPYASGNSITNGGIMTLSFPSAQTYCEGTFDPNAHLMVAESTTSSLVFKNVMCLLGFQFTGSGVQVKSVKLTGNTGEVLAGNVEVTPGNSPSYSFTGEGQKAITLTAGSPVTLDAVTPTVFWFVVPPRTYSNGFNILVTDKDDKEFRQSVQREITLAVNTAYKMGSLEVVPVEAVPTEVGFYEKAGIHYEFDEDSEQISIYEAENQAWVRCINPTTMKMYEVGPIPASPVIGSSFSADVVVSQNGAIQSSESLTMTVISLEDGILTLQSGTSYYVLQF